MDCYLYIEQIDSECVFREKKIWKWNMEKWDSKKKFGSLDSVFVPFLNEFFFVRRTWNRITKKRFYPKIFFPCEITNKKTWYTQIHTHTRIHRTCRWFCKRLRVPIFCVLVFLALFGINSVHRNFQWILLSQFLLFLWRK